MIIKINHRNLAIELPNGDVLADALAKRDLLKTKKSFLDGVLNKAVSRGYSEDRGVAMKVVLDTWDVQDEIDSLAKEYRELNTIIQSTNWAEDL